MGKRGLLLLAMAVVLPMATVAAVHWITSPVRPQRSSAATPGPSGQKTPQGSRPQDPNLPVYVGDTRRIAADAVDATAWASFEAALQGLGRRFRGSPARPTPPGSRPVEHLELDLTALDNLSFVEQLVALANSRQVSTRTEAVDRFTDHVRRLRYSDGRVGACTRLEQPSLWARAAEQRGYLVDLSRFLPGVSQRSIALAEPAAAGEASCRRAAGLPRRLQVAVLPLEAAARAATSLRSGDLFVIVPNGEKGSSGRIGMVQMDGTRIGALLAEPGVGVVRHADLLALVRRQAGTPGLSFLRPIPNGDGRRDR